jgi:pilus assembly protein CpaE
MPSSTLPSAGRYVHVTLVTPDSQLERSLAAEFEKESQLELRTIHGPLCKHLKQILSDEDAAAVIVEIDPANNDDLAALQQIRKAGGDRLPVIVLTERLFASTARQLLQLQVSDWIPKPLNAQEVVQACKRAMRATRTAALDQGATCYAFIGAAGGVGTTILAIETAFLLARRSRQFERTCLIDLDFQSGMVAEYLNLTPNLQLGEIGASPDRLDRQLLDVMMSRHESGLAVLAAPSALNANANINPVAVTRLLDLASRNFDAIVIDLPRAWQSVNRDILLGSNKVFIVTEMTVPRLRHARSLSDSFDEICGTQLQIGVIVNKRKTSFFGQYLKSSDVRQVLGPRLAGFVSAKDNLVREAIDRGIPLFQLSTSNRIDKDLSAILFTSR